MADERQGRSKVVQRSERLCECGCGERTWVSPRTVTTRGWVKGVPRRFLRGHSSRVPFRTPVARSVSPDRVALFQRLQGPVRACDCGCGGPAKDVHARFAEGHRWAGSRWIEEDRGYTTPCWVWQRGIDVHGYPRAHRAGEKLKAHRVAYEDAHGPVPPRFHVHHRCEVKVCVNPDHLQALSPEAHSQLHGAERMAA